MKTMHYTLGYGGKLNYHTLCGKEIHSHSDTESASIDPEKVTCSKCKKTNEWKVDLEDVRETKDGIKRRIFIESDVLDASDLRSVQGEVHKLCDEQGVPYVRRVFSEVLDYAWHDLEKTWAAVKKADEIYADSSLMPLVGGNYMGAPVIFNGMCERAIKENVTGKFVIILNQLENIEWDMIEMDVVKKAFKRNKLFTLEYNEDYSTKLVQVDFDKLSK